MSRKDDLERADRIIKDAEIRLRTVKVTLEAIEKEVDQLTAVEKQLEANVKFLKKKNIIALAVEYKKAKEDLTKAKARLTMIKNDREKIRQTYHDTELLIFNAKEAYEQAMKDATNNVVQGKFGRKNG